MCRLKKAKKKNVDPVGYDCARLSYCQPNCSWDQQFFSCQIYKTLIFFLRKF